jgi:LPS export ABC transporter permease LptG/LPS export ABC transporter permease LptF
MRARAGLTRMRLIDRYLIREVLPPFLLALAVFTFILAVRPMLDEAGRFLAKGAPVPTVGFLLLTLLPQSLAVTIPIALLAGLLMGLGRWSGDREAMALLACGVSPVRLLRPVLLLALIVGAIDLYVLIEAVPDANQTFREVTYRLLTEQAESDIRPRLFYEGFPGKVLYVREVRPGGGWNGVLIADTSRPGRPTVTVADSGQLVMDDAGRKVDLVLRQAETYLPGVNPGIYDRRFGDPERVQITAESVYGAGATALSRGLAEKTVAELQRDVEAKRAAGESPHNEIMFIHQKFAFPVACLVFALLALALGLHTRKEGKLAGLTLGLGVLFVYYGIHALAEGGAKGHVIPAELARWLPNLALGPLGVLAVWWRSRARGHELTVPVPLWVTRLSRGRRRSQPAAAAAAPARVAVVVRLPSAGLPRPRLLDLYVSGRYVRITVLAFVGLLGLYYIATFIDLSEKMFKGQATGSMMAQYLWYSTPQFIVLLMPMATLVAVLSTIGGLTRTSELTVMRACGVSLYRVAAPLMLLALVSSGALFLLDERVVAEANRKAATLEDIIRGRAPRTVDVANRNWLAAPDRIYYYVAFDARRATLYALSVFETAADPFRIVTHTYAERAASSIASAPATPDEATFVAWRAERGWVQHFGAVEPSSREDFSERTLLLPTPDTYGGARAEADLMTYAELREHVRRLGESGFSVDEERFSLNRKIAFPLATVVMTLLAVPFAVTTGRRGALYGIGLAIALAVGYAFVETIFGFLGSAGKLAAPLAAWSPNILFASAAGYLLLRVRT